MDLFSCQCEEFSQSSSTRGATQSQHEASYCCYFPSVYIDSAPSSQKDTGLVISDVSELFPGPPVKYLSEHLNIVSFSNTAKLVSPKVSTVTYGHICLCFHSIPDSTGTSCGSQSSPPACRPSCRWSYSGNNTVRQEALTYPPTPPTRAGRGSQPKQDVTCGVDICRRSADPSRARLSPGRTDVSRTPSRRWWSCRQAENSFYYLFIIHIVWILLEWLLSTKLLLKTH